MANCRNCKKGVGCGCNLNKEGLCATCAKAKAQQPIPTPPVINNNVIK